MSLVEDGDRFAVCPSVSQRKAMLWALSEIRGKSVFVWRWDELVAEWDE